MDHIGARRLRDDISLPKQLFALVAVHMRQLLDGVIDITLGSPEDFLISSLATGFRGTLTSGDAMRKAYTRVARKHVQLAEFTESSASFPVPGFTGSHVERVSALAGAGVSSGELSVPGTATSMDLP